MIKTKEDRFFYKLKDSFLNSPFILKNAYRNLLRQKKRNIILSIAMSIGLTFLILSNSFSAGISDLMINKFITMMTGHISINVRERTHIKGDIIRDKTALVSKIKQEIPGYDYIEEVLTAWGTMIGVKGTQAVMISGMSPEKLSRQKTILSLRKGSYESFLNTPDGAMIYENTAEKLNLKIGDYVNARFLTPHGQMQGVKYQITTILKKASFFQSMTLIVNFKRFKKDMGLRQNEAKGLWVMLKDPKNAKTYADRFHDALKPLPALFSAKDQNNQTIFLTAPDTLKKKVFYEGINIEGSFKKESKNVVLLPAEFKKRGFRVGSEMTIKYKTVYHTVRSIPLSVGGFYTLKNQGQQLNVALPAILSEKTFYKNYYEYRPELKNSKNLYGGMSALHYRKALSRIDFFSNTIARTWTVLRRSDTTKDIMAKYAELNRDDWRGAVIDVRTMYETGEQFLQLEQALKSLTFTAFIVILMISLIGVGNTLKITIRERRKEIGTLRSIGMQQKDVRKLFTSEYMMLAFFASIIGILFSLSLISLISSVHIETSEAMAMFLNENHLHFVVKPLNLLFYMFILIAVTGFFSWFPAQKASKANPAETLRK